MFTHHYTHTAVSMAYPRIHVSTYVSIVLAIVSTPVALEGEEEYFHDRITNYYFQGN
jgi:hypothetical protein